MTQKIKLALGILIIGILLLACGGNSQPPTPRPTPTPKPWAAFEAVCNGDGSIEDAVAYNPSGAKAGTVFPVVMMQGSRELADKASLPHRWRANDKEDSGKVALVACLEVTDQPLIHTCDYKNSKGFVVHTINYYSLVYKVTVYAAQTGEKVGHSTITEGDFDVILDICPLSVWGNVGRFSDHYPNKSYDNIKEFISTYVEVES
ncbi:MAG: hypothetical protein GY797_24260 [Deltaproteobacteria bacterium]|nr:hypothetical protein [Deltaproteobacteria bacterium]